VDIGEIRDNLTKWDDFAPKAGDTSKSKDLFLKVHDGKLSFEMRAELPKGMKWLRAKSEYSFDKNIQALRAVLDNAHANITKLQPEERSKLQELQTVHNELVERYERKNTPGIIGRILISLGLKDYSKAVQEAINKKKCTYDWDVPTETPKKTVVVPPRPETPTEMAQGGIKSILRDEIEEFSKEANKRYAALFNKKTGEADIIRKQLQALTIFQIGINSANAGEKLEKFHQQFDIAKLPAAPIADEQKPREEIGQKAKELRRTFLPVLEDYRKLAQTNPAEFAAQAPLMSRLSEQVNQLTTFEAMAKDANCTLEEMQQAFDAVHQAIGAIVKEGQAAEAAAASEEQANAAALVEERVLDADEMAAIAGIVGDASSPGPGLASADIDEDAPATVVMSGGPEQYAEEIAALNRRVDSLADESVALEAARSQQGLPELERLSSFSDDAIELQKEILFYETQKLPIDAALTEKINAAEVLFSQIKRENSL